MRALEQVAKSTGREPEDTGGGVRVITYLSPTRARYVVEVAEVDDDHVSVTARHLDAEGVPCACDDGAGIWAWDRIRPEHVERAIFDAQTFIIRHVCEVSPYTVREEIHHGPYRNVRCLDVAEVSPAALDEWGATSPYAWRKPHGERVARELLTTGESTVGWARYTLEVAR